MPIPLIVLTGARKGIALVVWERRFADRSERQIPLLRSGCAGSHCFFTQKQFLSLGLAAEVNNQ